MKVVRWFILVVWINVLWTLSTCSSVSITPQASLEPTPELTRRPSQEPTPVLTTQPPLDVTELLAGRAPSFQGITPGVSHKRDVLAQWGEPKVVRTHDEYESLHYTTGKLLIKDDVVLSVTSGDRQGWLVHNGHPATADDLYQILGAPKVITPTIGSPILVFLQYGLAIRGWHVGVHYYYQFFAPMSLQEYQALWGQMPLECDPFPLIPSVETVAIEPGTTTRDGVTQWLGAPDWIWANERDESWYYCVEPDMLGRLVVYFNTQGTVESMDIAPAWRSRPLRLEETIDRYGPPDVVQLFPGSEGAEYRGIGLVYLNRGVRVGAICTMKCNIIRRDMVVDQKWYFRPMALAEYQAMFSDSGITYIEYPGFDE